jgi:hypothetical protein
MARTPPVELLNAVQSALRAVPDGARIETLIDRLSIPVSRRTLQRRLSAWSSAGVIGSEGEGKGRRYFAVDTSTTSVVTPGPRELNLSSATPVIDAVPLSPEGTAIRDFVRLPVAARSPVGYERQFLDRYVPNSTTYLSGTVTRHLYELGRTPNGTRPAGTYARDILGRLLIDLSWASSRLEGNTYSLLDTEQLINQARIPSGKDPKETQMILNHKAAIELLVDSTADVGVNRFTLLNLHAVLADNLLEEPSQAGRLRGSPVGIAGSAYTPTAIPQLIEEQFGQMLRKGRAIRDPFEQSFFLMVHIPYLQPFADVNKRTSRLAANISLIRDNYVPLSFVDVPERAYVDGLMGVYERTRVELLRDVFVWAYERSCLRYKTVRDSLPEPDPFRLEHRQEFIDVVGSIVRDQLRPTAQQVATLAAPQLKGAELKRFTQMVLEELGGLHEGNIARFRLRPSEFRRWRESITPAARRAPLKSKARKRKSH